MKTRPTKNKRMAVLLTLCMALSLLPRLMALSRKKLGADEEILVLTATSGDTGKAALEGFCGVPGTRIIVFYPENGVSDVQRAQMELKLKPQK